jgi:hypothetical protein
MQMQMQRQCGTSCHQTAGRNGSGANPSKTVFMMLNSKQKEHNLPKKIKVRDHEIMESKSVKLLRVVINNGKVTSVAKVAICHP